MLEEEAYAAMFIFLESYWERNGQSEDIGILLGSMHLLEDGMPADGAVWQDWLDAVAKSKKLSG
ncbi:hypothetical protein ABE488_07470 [Luteimonas sp. TWI662]|uniref:hypothetical protein n=1 Tax=Luteimonas sp. TWI662 TaxID=3136789 RepID=UPI0032082318